jgi:hypothetical protein
MIKQHFKGFITAFNLHLKTIKNSEKLVLLFRHLLKWKAWNGLRKIRLKWVSAAAICTLACLLTSDIVYFLNTTNVKDTLQKRISNVTQQNVTIDGPVQWYLGRHVYLEASNLTLNSPAPFSQDLAVIKKIRFTPHFWSLFTGKMTFDIEVSDLTLNLERMASGYSNWQHLTDQWVSPSFSSYTPLGHFIFSEFKINSAEINFQDEQFNHQYIFHAFNLSADPINRALQGQLTPISLQFNLEDPTVGLLGSYSLQASYLFTKNFDKIEVQNFLLKTQLPNLPETKLSGAFDILNLKKSPEAIGNLNLKNLDMASWLNTFGIKEVPSLPKTEELAAKFNYKDSWLEVPNFTLFLQNQGMLEGSFKVSPSLNMRMIDGQGVILGKALTLNNVEMKQLKASVLMKEGVMDITPIEFQLAKGRHHGSIHIEYDSLITKFNLMYTGENFEMDALLKSFGNPKAIEGKARLKTTLSSRGTTLEQLRKNLAGQAELEINNGHLYGVDLLYLLKHAQSSVKSLIYTSHYKQPTRINPLLSAELKEWQEQAGSTHPFFTPFDTIKASALITNGVLNNPDLIVQHPQFTLEGKGTLNLNQEALHYRLFAHYNEPAETSMEITNFLKTTPLGIQVTGFLGNPAVNPELDAYTQNALKFSQKNMLEKFPDKTLDKYINDVSS